MEKTKTYSEKLRDPRWQKKRLQILDRDKWRCTDCFADDKTLHVHHLDYESGAEPWDYPDHYLVTLCEECHKETGDSKEEREGNILKAYRLNVKDSFTQKCLSSILWDSKHIQRIIYLIWELGPDTAQELMEAEFLRQGDVAHGEYIKNILATMKCPACHGDMKYSERHKLTKCVVCGYSVSDQEKFNCDKV